MEARELAHEQRLNTIDRGPAHSDYGPILVRSDGSVQIGLAHGRASVVTGVDLERENWAEALELRHLSAPRTQPVTSMQSPHVHVLGRGPVAAAIAEVIVRAGVAKVVRVTGRRRSEARCDLAVLVDPYPVSIEAARWWQETEVPFLPVQVWRKSASLGPLVVPGSTACIRCLEFTRAELDPDWPFLRAQLPQSRAGLTPVVSCEPSLLAVVAGLTGALVESNLLGELSLDSRSWELTVPGPVVTEHQWSVHPLCRCTDHLGSVVAS